VSDSAIESFLKGSCFAVVGASNSRRKYGNKVLRCYQQAGRRALPVNPHRDRIEGVGCVPDLASLPEAVHGVSVITQPRVTESIARDVVAAGIEHVWMQPGAESPAAIATLEDAGVNVIHGGPCILVVLGFRDR
jgi:predicted CoA-binding protein